MKKMTIILQWLFISLFPVLAHASQNPIDWSLTPATGLPAQTTVGSSYVVTYTVTNKLPFAQAVTTVENHTGGQFGVTDTCGGVTLGAKNSGSETCHISISFSPLDSGSNTYDVTLSYGNTRIPLPTLSSTSSGTGPTEDVQGHVTGPLPSITYTGSGYPVSFTFTNDGTTSVTATSVDVTGFTASSNTCTVAVFPNASCVVSGTFSPTVVGHTTLSVTYNYDGGAKSVPLSTQTTVQTGGGTCHSFDGDVVLPLPTTTSQYADNVVKYTFTNHCNAASETLGTATLSATIDGTPVSGWLTKGTDTCSGATLAADASCSIFVAVIPQTTGSNLIVTANVPYNSNTQTATVNTNEAVTAVSNPTTQHNITFVNQCPFPVWYGFANGNGNDGGIIYSPDPTPSGARTPDDYKLGAQLSGARPVTKTLSFSAYTNGAIFPRTGCSVVSNKLVCQTGTCTTIDNTGTCVLRGTSGDGAAPPLTKLEAFMSPTANSDGVYDVSVINGFNTPASFRSLAPATSSVFGCGQEAGALIQPAGSTLGACSWSFTPPTGGIDAAPNYVFTSEGADDACTSDASCGIGEHCGTAFASINNAGGATPINRRCGTFIGYWTVAQFAGFSAGGQWGSTNLYTNYSLGTVLPAGPNGSYGNVGGNPATYTAIYGCTPTDNGSLDSGYSATSNVCGCYDWNQGGSVAPTAQESNCVGFNTDWLTTIGVFARISWLKTACPTSYTYQFDDKSSSFTCNTSGQFTSYQIVFCPGGKTGEPGT